MLSKRKGDVNKNVIIILSSPCGWVRQVPTEARCFWSAAGLLLFAPSSSLHCHPSPFV